MKLLDGTEKNQKSRKVFKEGKFLKYMNKKILMPIALMFLFWGMVLVSAINCTDSDGGKNYFEKGTITDYFCFEGGSCSPTYFTDKCLSSEKLYEAYCLEDGSGWSAVEIICDAGCVDGACKQGNIQDASTKGTCIDSDGGINYYQKGRLEIKGNPSWGVSIIEDYCTDTPYPKDKFPYPPIGGRTTEGKYLSEYSCAMSSFPLFGTNVEEVFRGEQYECPYGCKDGACLNQSNYEMISPDVDEIDNADRNEENFFKRILNWFKKMFGGN